jgi:dTDP-4-amino-4,6-dideoxygalactose transaminase
MIPFFSFSREPEDLRLAMRAAFDRIVASGVWILGPEVREFETLWAQRCGVSHAVGTGNGLDALEIALRSLGIGEGSEVITTPMTALATVLAIKRAGAIPRLADIDPGTALLDVASAERCLTDRTRAIVPVHLYGNVSAAPIWESFARENGISLVQDCAQSHLAVVNGRQVGSFGIASAFSFYPTKNLGAVGDAGALVTSDEGLAERARMIRNYGQQDRYHHVIEGMNSRLDELQAALLIARLNVLDEQTNRRREIADRYYGEINSPFVRLLDRPREAYAHVHHLFVLRSEARDQLQEHLTRCRVGSLVHYPVPAHLQRPFEGVLRDPLGLSNSELHAAECLSIPCHSGLHEQEVDEVIAAVNSFRP